MSGPIGSTNAASAKGITEGALTVAQVDAQIAELDDLVGILGDAARQSLHAHVQGIVGRGVEIGDPHEECSNSERPEGWSWNFPVDIKALGLTIRCRGFVRCRADFTLEDPKLMFTSVDADPVEITNRAQVWKIARGQRRQEVNR